MPTIQAGGRTRLPDAAGLIAGFALDAVFGDPHRLHPVAGFGRAVHALEQTLYRPHRTAGVMYTAIAVGIPVAVAAVTARAIRRHPFVRAGIVAAATWTVLGGRSLHDEATLLAQALAGGDLDAARQRLPHLCGRDPSTLDSSELARATVESVAENTSDAVVAPLFWGAVAGLPGLLGYRAINTLDAMVGHRSPRYARFGTAAARLDDGANLIPSRITGLFTIVAAPLVGGNQARTWRIWRRDRHQHPSPNAGQCESAMAGALDVRLGGRNVYNGHTEVRPFLGDGHRPESHDVSRAVKLSTAIGAAAALLAAVGRAITVR